MVDEFGQGVRLNYVNNWERVGEQRGLVFGYRFNLCCTTEFGNKAFFGDCRLRNICAVQWRQSKNTTWWIALKRSWAVCPCRLNSPLHTLMPPSIHSPYGLMWPQAGGLWAGPLLFLSVFTHSLSDTWTDASQRYSPPRVCVLDVAGSRVWFILETEVDKKQTGMSWTRTRYQRREGEGRDQRETTADRDKVQDTRDSSRENEMRT